MEERSDKRLEILRSLVSKSVSECSSVTSDLDTTKVTLPPPHPKSQSRHHSLQPYLPYGAGLILYPLLYHIHTFCMLSCRLPAVCSPVGSHRCPCVASVFQEDKVSLLEGIMETMRLDLGRIRREAEAAHTCLAEAEPAASPGLPSRLQAQVDDLYAQLLHTQQQLHLRTNGNTHTHTHLETRWPAYLVRTAV